MKKWSLNHFRTMTSFFLWSKVLIVRYNIENDHWKKNGRSKFILQNSPNSNFYLHLTQFPKRDESNHQNACFSSQILIPGAFFNSIALICKKLPKSKVHIMHDPFNIFFFFCHVRSWLWCHRNFKMRKHLHVICFFQEQIELGISFVFLATIDSNSQHNNVFQEIFFLLKPPMRKQYFWHPTS